MKISLRSPDGMLAQLVEQRTFNPFVVGSTPAHPTKYALWALKSLLL
jgi:hypothetical protein